MSHVRRAVACTIALTAALFSFALPAGSVPAPSTTAANSAVSWLETQQQADGGFEVAGFPGFETRDAALAIAENAQTSATWSTSEAIAAVGAVHFGGTPAGDTPLNALDDYAATITTAGAAAKTIVLSASALGLDPAAFDAAGDGSPVDLESIMGCDTTTGTTFSDTLYIVLGQALACGGPQAAAVAAVRDAQQTNGGWNFLGDPTGTDVDLDSTSVAVEGLVAAGADASDPAVEAALGFYAANQQANGAWQSFGADDPNSTSLGILGITAAGYDVESPCWRDTADPSLDGTAYASPTAWIISQQQPDGRVVSPNDGFGLNTFATSQSVEGLLQSWLPIGRATEQTCSLPPTPTVDTTTPVVGGAVTVSGGGFAPSVALTIELHSTPVVLGTTTTDGFGNYTATVTIPADTDPGVHQLVVSGLGPDGQLRTVSIEIMVLAAGATAPVAVSTAPRFTG